jgi:membrane-associated HD superfamily phosphohydrolase
MIPFYLQYGVMLPSWVKPDARLMELFPFVRMAVERPWYYYAAKLAFTMPLALVAVWLLIRERQLWRHPAIQIAAAWFFIVVAALTVMGIDGYGFQMRHIAPAIAAVYVIILVALLERERPALLMVCAFSMLVGTVTGAMHLLAPEFAEIVSLLRVAGFANY